MDQIRDRMLLLVPSSGNPDGARDLNRRLLSLSTGRTDIAFYIDGDVEGYPATAPYITGPPVPYGQAINALWKKYPWYRLYMLGSSGMQLEALNERKVFAIYDLLDDCAIVSDTRKGAPILSNRMIDVMGRALPGFGYSVCREWLMRIGNELSRLFFIRRDILDSSVNHEEVGFFGDSAEKFKSKLWDENESERLIARIRSEFNLPEQRSNLGSWGLFRDVAHTPTSLY